MIRLLDATWTQVAQNPGMLAHRNIPWQAVAMNAAPIQASFPTARPSNTSDPDDEDAAESRLDPNDQIGNLIASNPPPQPVIGPKPAVPLPPPPPASVAVAGASGSIHLKLPLPNIRPKPAPRGNMLVASLTPRTPPPNIRPSSRADALGEGDIGDLGTPTRGQPAKAIAKSMASTGVRDWTIQIGAFGDAPSAKAQLTAYATRSKDVLGTAERIVVPFQSVDGKTLYRARFGPFVEAEARAVCQRMTERKQTCFAALAH
jgi:D-alanyl-D-alanine carboxypeptidase